MKTKIIIALSIGMVAFTSWIHAADDDECKPQKCVEAYEDCKKGSSGGGSCDWEGGSVCTGAGDCPLTDGVHGDIKDATCEVGAPNDKCETQPGKSFMDVNCAVLCKAVPFVSCKCEKSGSKGGQVYSYNAKGCKS